MANENVFIHDLPLSVFAEYFTRKSEHDSIEGSRRYTPVMEQIKADAIAETFKLGDESVTLLVNDPLREFERDGDRVEDATKLRPAENESIEITEDADADRCKDLKAYALNYECYMRSLFGGISFYPYFGVIRGEYYYSVSPVTKSGALGDFAINIGPDEKADDLDPDSDRLVSVRFGGTIDFSRMKAVESGSTIDIDAGDADRYSTAYHSLMLDGREIGRIYRLHELARQRYAVGKGYEYIDEYTGKTVHKPDRFDSPFALYHKAMRDVTLGGDLTADEAVSDGKAVWTIKPALSQSEPAGKWLMSIEQADDSSHSTIGALMPYSAVSPALAPASGIVSSVKTGSELTGYVVSQSDMTTAATSHVASFIEAALDFEVTDSIPWWSGAKGRYGLKTIAGMKSAASDAFGDEFADYIAYLMIIWLLQRHRLSNGKNYRLESARVSPFLNDRAFSSMTAGSVASFIYETLMIMGYHGSFGLDGTSTSIGSFIGTIEKRFAELTSAADESHAGMRKFISRFIGQNGNYVGFDCVYNNYVFLYSDADITKYYDGCALSSAGAWTSIASYLRDNLMHKTYMPVYGATTSGTPLTGVSMPRVSVDQNGNFESSEGIFPNDAASVASIGEDGAIGEPTRSEIMAYLAKQGFGISDDAESLPSSILYKLSYYGMNDVSIDLDSGTCANVTIFDDDELTPESRLVSAGLRAKLLKAARASAPKASGWFDVGIQDDLRYSTNLMMALSPTARVLSPRDEKAVKAIMGIGSSDASSYYRNYHRYCRLGMRFLTGFAEIDGSYYRYMMYYPGQRLLGSIKPVLRLISMKGWIGMMADYYKSIDNSVDSAKIAMIGVKTNDGKIKYYYCTYSRSISTAIDGSKLAIPKYAGMKSLRSAFSDAGQLKCNGVMGEMIRESGRMYLSLKQSIMDAVDSMFASASQRTLSGLISDDVAMDAHLYGVESDLMPLFRECPDNPSDATKRTERMAFSYVQMRNRGPAKQSSASTADSKTNLKPGDAEEIGKRVDSDSPFYKIARYSDYGTDASAKASLASGADSMLGRQKLMSHRSVRTAPIKQKAAERADKHDAAGLIKSILADFMAGFAFHGDESESFGRDRYSADYDLHFKDKVRHVTDEDDGFRWVLPTGGADGYIVSFSNEHADEASRTFMSEFRKQKEGE